MTRNKQLVLALVGASVAALVAWPVYAHCGRCAGDVKGMIKMMGDGKTSLGAAVEAAEKHSSGKAVMARCEMEKGKLEIAVYCLVGEKIQEVEIDGATGKVAGMEEHKMLPAVMDDEMGEHKEHEEEEDDD